MGPDVPRVQLHGSQVGTRPGGPQRVAKAMWLFCLTSETICLRPKQNVEPNGLELFGQEDLCKTTGFVFFFFFPTEAPERCPTCCRSCVFLSDPLCFLSLLLVES